VKYIFPILLLCFITAQSGGLISAVQFNQDMLDNPAQFRGDYEQIFAHNEISRFRGKSEAGKLVLENGYASALLKNGDEWTKIKKGKKVIEITIVFTKYPRFKNDWITNYDVLLASRLKELFRLDPSLNNKEISWRLLLQTDCRNDKQTRTFFHGIVIRYDSEKSALQNQQKNNSEVVKTDEQKDNQKENQEEYKAKYLFEDENDFFEQNSFLYRETTQGNVKKKKKHKEPACPDFSGKRKSIIK